MAHDVTPPPDASSRARGVSRRRLVMIVVGLLVLTLGLPLLIRTFAVEAFKIPGASMSPTLRVGDHLFVWKLGGAPSRGDVVVFPFPEDPRVDFIKRVVGLAGEKLTFVNGRLAIDGQLVPRCEVGPYEEGTLRGTIYVEFLGEPHAVFYTGKEETCTTPHDCDGDACMLGLCGEVRGPFEVAPGEVFVLGDNRDNSYDSRMWRDGAGAGVPIGSVKGRGSRIFLREGSFGFGPVVGVPGDLPPSLREAAARCLAEGPR